jgi:urea carboxylase
MTNQLPFWQTISVNAGDTLAIGRAQDAGTRCYLCVRDGVQVENYLGSKSTFTLGQFGGHGGRTVRIGDVLHLVQNTAPAPKKILPPTAKPAIHTPMAFVCDGGTTRRAGFFY